MYADAEARDFWRVAIVEDHLLQRERTEEILEKADGLRVVGTFETLPDYLQWSHTTAPRERPHLLVLDLVVDRRPSVDPETVRRLVDGGLRVLVLSAMASPTLVREILKAGVTGMVGKRDTPDMLLEAVWAVLGRQQWMSAEVAAVMAGDAHRPDLSIQEERALTLYATGLTLQEVATIMNVKPDTAKSYLSRVKRKYADRGRLVRSKVDLHRAATEDGLLDASRPPR